jgi:DNA-binding Lrp family transcriptional regulator
VQGWIKLHRKILENEIWHDVTTFRLFTLLLLQAVHKDGVKVKGIELKRGQYLRSYSKLAEDLEYKEKRGFKKVSKSTVLRSVKKLVDEGIVSVNETGYGTVFTILKYHEYQGFDDDNETPIKTVNEPLSERNRNVIETLSKQEQELKNLRIKELNTSTKDPVDVIAEKFIDLRTVAEGRSVYPTTKDYEAIARIVARGMPLPQTIKLLEQCFAEYKERQPNGAIKAFGYCEKYIMDHYEALVAREQAKEAAKNVKSFKNNNSFKPKVMRAKPIRTEMLPDWFDDEDQQHEKPKLLKNEQQELAKKKADLQEKLKLLRSGS